MSETIRASIGRKVVSRASAENLGVVNHFLVDDRQRQIQSIIVGKGKKARFVDWAQLSGFGPDAVMIAGEDSLRAAADDRERAAAEGKLDLVGKRTLTELGNELGSIEDVTFDESSGMLEELLVGERHLPAGSLLGSGSYAAVFDREQEP
jgi:uncharacterized protein YrrD